MNIPPFIQTITDDLLSLVEKSRENAKSLSADQRTGLIAKCEEVMRAKPGSPQKVAAELVRCGILLENEGFPRKKRS